MKERRLTTHQHLEALHTLLEIPFRGGLGARINKEQILESLGFSKGTNIAVKREFILPETPDQALGIRDYAAGQLADGKFLSMLFKDGNWEAMGGAPVAYIMSEDDLRDKLTFEEERLVKAQAHNGEVVAVDHQINLQTYSRRKSMKSELTGFTNYEGVVPVRVGGGFRLQVDNFIFIDDQPHMTLSAYFSFNDMGSRVLAQTCEEDCLVPRYETSIQLKIEDGRIMFPDSLSEGDENLIVTNEAGEVVNQVLKSLFKRDGQAISDLLQGLVSIRPAMKVHQLEGIFSVPSEKEISAEVIDFDGIDSFDITGQTTSLSPAERLMSGKLKRVGYLQTDPDSILSYILFRNKVKDAVCSLTESDIIEEDVKVEISRHFPNSPDIITKEQTGAVKLGRLLKSVGVDWEETDNPCIKQFQNGANLITAISIEGYELAFWKKGPTLVDCRDIKTLSHDLSDLIGVEILPVHLSSLREGD